MKPQTVLKILLVLSMITAGTNCINSFNIAVLPGIFSQVPAMMEQYGFDEHTVGAMKQIVEDSLALPRGYHLGLAALWALSFTGCLLMWKYRRTGFHCYTLAQLLLLLLPMLFLGKSAQILGDAMFAALFIFFYWRLLKTINESSESSESSEPSDPSE